MRSMIVLLGCLGAFACSDVGFDVRSLTELEKAEARWARVGPGSYVYAVERVCYCTIESIGPVRVRVGGNTTVRTYADTGEPVPEAMEHLFPTVEGLFVVLRAAYTEGAEQVEVSYDPALGYPTEFWIDYDEMMADEELGMRVTESPVATFPALGGH